MWKYILQLWVAATLLFSCEQHGRILVKDTAALQEAIADAAAGDTIVMQEGKWKDVDLKFVGEGTAEAPIVLMAEKEGKVVLTGNSFLEIGGSYLEVHGLVFKEGYAKKRSVIRFKSGKALAFHSRLTACVIDGFNPPNRFDKNYWVEVHGQHNQIDHCYFGGKLNSGVTLAVRLNDKRSLNNHHKIINNYFGPRPKLGSNGGETLRVGVSTYSLESSNTLIENNYFDRCSGEVEVVSIKSSDNIIKGNTFYACGGVLALRHGNRNQILNNYFLGENEPNTGGIRVINAGHTIEGNHFQELTGQRFFGTIPVMNGVPNSLINRYHHAQDVKITNNHFFYCDYITLGVGADKERTEAPENIVFSNNLFYHPEQKTLITSKVPLSGFTFENNTYRNRSGQWHWSGMKATDNIYNKDENGLYSNVDYQPVLTATAQTAGPAWYKNTGQAAVAKGTNKRVKSQFQQAMAEAQEGDTLTLEMEEVRFEEPIVLTKTVVIQTEKQKKVTFRYPENEKQQPFFIIDNGGSLSVSGIRFEGRSSKGIAKSAIRTVQQPMIQHYNLNVEYCDFVDFDASKYCAFEAAASTFADTVAFRHCTFENISGNAINLNGEREQQGKYNAEYVVMEDCKFYKVMGSALAVTRMGNDESTTGPKVNINRCEFVEVNNKELGSVLLLWGVQQLHIEDVFFQDAGRSGRIIKFEDPAWANSYIDYVLALNSGKIETFYPRAGKHIYQYPEGNYTPEKVEQWKKTLAKGHYLGMPVAEESLTLNARKDVE
ncbi:polysaccharide lyase 6 family protein [Algivirga pacifica]|uniref:Poly(Beta-D-mannuronate) lyase n=1 Tax=Algivirga pacifica TaxID=1162670 RepID=A0ABP9DLC1_9BACT